MRKVVSSVGRREIFIVMGDLNARVEEAQKSGVMFWVAMGRILGMRVG